ncbi:MAG: acylphosphatase [Bacteroidia bacterium]|nr:acylphosphatase [Bacteroidia bacterium]
MHVSISGFVQGVGFRYFVLRIAEGLSINGWVRNCADGRVEVLAQGREIDLRILLEDLRKGPMRSAVADVRVTWEESENVFQTFEIR